MPEGDTNGIVRDKKSYRGAALWFVAIVCVALAVFRKWLPDVDQSSA